ncbi:MAG: VWA domain-containing protein [Desulfofustis sp.]|jgi:Ca-activated chloride channel family protein|nr:VWA domain-containing protein [Desulfofustis sp.]
MAEFHFIRPWLLVVLVPMLALWWGLWRMRRQGDNRQALIDPHLLEHLLVGEPRKRLLRPVYLLLVVWILAAVAVAGPSWQKEVSPFLSDEAALMVMLKVSDTMETTDVQPSRLERAKQKIRDLMDLRQGGATGLIVYSGSAHLVMPVTRDERIIGTMLEGISTDLMPVQGDVLSAALDLGQQTVEQSGLPGSLLVIADSVSEQITEDLVLPVQFLAIQSVDREIDAGLQQAVKSLGGHLQRMGADRSDVERIVARAETSHREASEPGQAERWKDGGYLLLPLIAAGTLLWFRKGWVIG